MYRDIAIRCIAIGFSFGARYGEFFSAGGYDSVIILANQINATREKAFYLSELFDQTDEEIIEVSKIGDTSAVKEKIRSASAEFYKENYAVAEELLKQAEDEIEKLKSQVSLQQVTQGESGYIKFIRDNIALFAAALLAGVFYVVFFHRRLEIKKKYHRLQQLDGMEKNTKSAMSQAQKGYFVNKTMDRYEYRTKMNTFRRHLGKIKKECLIISRELKKDKK